VSNPNIQVSKLIYSSGGSRPGVWGDSQIGGRQEGLHLL